MIPQRCLRNFGHQSPTDTASCQRNLFLPVCLHFFCVSVYPQSHPLGLPSLGPLHFLSFPCPVVPQLNFCSWNSVLPLNMPRLLNVQKNRDELITCSNYLQPPRTTPPPRASVPPLRVTKQTSNYRQHKSICINRTSFTGAINYPRYVSATWHH